MKLSPHRLTHRFMFLAFAVCLRLVTGTRPLAHAELYLQNTLSRGCTSMHFGENQLSPRSIGISPLSTAHPPVLQHGWVRASTAGQSRFTLAMDSSRGFGSHARHALGARPIQTRLPCGCPTLLWVNRATRMHS